MIICLKMAGIRQRPIKMWPMKAVTRCSKTVPEQIVSRTIPPTTFSSMWARLRTWRSEWGRARWHQGRPRRERTMLNEREGFLVGLLVLFSIFLSQNFDPFQKNP